MGCASGLATALFKDVPDKTTETGVAPPPEIVRIAVASLTSVGENLILIGYAFGCSAFVLKTVV